MLGFSTYIVPVSSSNDFDCITRVIHLIREDWQTTRKMGALSESKLTTSSLDLEGTLDCYEITFLNVGNYWLEFWSPNVQPLWKTLLNIRLSQLAQSIHHLSFQYSGQDILHHQAKILQFNKYLATIHLQIFLPNATPAPFHSKACICHLLVIFFEQMELYFRESGLFDWRGQ